MASPSETGVTNQAAIGENPSRRVVFLVKPHLLRGPRRRFDPCHEDDLPEVPTPEILNTLLPTFEVLTNETNSSVDLMPMNGTTLVQCPSVQTDHIFHTSPRYYNINGSGQISSEVRGEGIMTATSTPDRGFYKFKPTGQRATEPANRRMATGVYTAADPHRQFDSKCTQDAYIEWSSQLKSTTDLASNCINCIAPPTLRPLGTHSEQEKQIQWSTATELTESTSCMKSRTQVSTSKTKSTTELATTKFAKPLSYSYFEVDNENSVTNYSLKEEKKQNERNNRKGIVAPTDTVIDDASHDRINIQSNPTWMQMQRNCHTLGSSNKKYILITSRMKGVAPSRCPDKVAEDESRPLTKGTSILSSENDLHNEGTNTPVLISRRNLLKDPINESHTSDDKQFEYDNPTYLKLSKDTGFPDCLPSPDRTFLAALLSEDNEPFDEWFASKSGDIGPCLKEFILDGTNKDTLSKTMSSTHKKESKTEPDTAGSMEDILESRTDKSFGDNDSGSSLPGASKTGKRLMFESKEEEDQRTPSWSTAKMKTVPRPITSKLVSSSPVLDDVKGDEDHQLKQKLHSTDSEWPVELADHQYTLSASPLKENVLTSKRWTKDGDMSNNLHREGVNENQNENHVAEVSTVRDVALSEKERGGSKKSPKIEERLSSHNDDNSGLVTDAFITQKSSCDDSVNVTSVDGRRESSGSGTLTAVTPGPVRFSDSTVAIGQSDDDVQEITKPDEDVMNEKVTSAKSFIVENEMQQGKGSTLFDADVNINQNCSRDQENRIVETLSVRSNQASFDIRQQTVPRRDEQVSIKSPSTRQSATEYSVSGYSTPKSKNESKMKGNDVTDAVDDKSKRTPSTERKLNSGEKSQGPSNNSLISDVEAKVKDAFSQSKSKHDYNLRSRNRYKNKPNGIIFESSPVANGGSESSIKCPSEKEVVHGVLRIKCDHHCTQVKCCKQALEGNKSSADESFCLEKRTLNKVEIVSDILKGRPSESLRKAERKQKFTSQPANRDIEQTPLQESRVQVSSEKDQDRHCNVSNCCMRNQTDANIGLRHSDHPTIGHADIAEKEEPSYRTRHFMRTLEIFPRKRTSLSIKHRKSKNKISAEEGDKSITTKSSGKELSRCKRFSTLRSRISSRKGAETVENKQKQFPSKMTKARKSVSPLRTDDRPSNTSSTLLKVKFPFSSGRITRKVSDHRESRSQRKIKKSQENATTSRSTKIATVSKPQLTMKLRLLPLRRAIKLKQNLDLLRRKKTKI